MKLYINYEDHYVSYVGGGYEKSYASIETYPIEKTSETKSEPVEYDRLGNALSGSGCEETIETYSIPWHTSACDVAKAIRRRERFLRKCGIKI